MDKIFFYGDSGNKASVLQAYRAAYRSNISVVSKLVTEMAAHIFETQYGLSMPSLKNNSSNSVVEYTAPIYKLLRQSLVVCNYYYEHAQTEDNRLFRCFMSLCAEETALIVVAHKLADFQYQNLMTTEIMEQAQNS